MTAAMTEAEVLAALEEAHAVLSGHFKLTSGRHSDRYVQPRFKGSSQHQFVERSVAARRVLRPAFSS